MCSRKGRKGFNVCSDDTGWTGKERKDCSFGFFVDCLAFAPIFFFVPVQTSCHCIPIYTLYFRVIPIINYEFIIMHSYLPLFPCFLQQGGVYPLLLLIFGEINGFLLVKLVGYVILVSGFRRFENFHLGCIDTCF